MNDVGTLGGNSTYPSIVKKSMNNFGQAVGSSETLAGAQHAFLWKKTIGMTDLGTLGGASSSAAAINDLGVVVGAATDANGLSHAVAWQGGAISELAALAPGCKSGASSVNSVGQIVGWS